MTENQENQENQEIQENEANPEVVNDTSGEAVEVEEQQKPVEVKSKAKKAKKAKQGIDEAWSKIVEEQFRQNLGSKQYTVLAENMPAVMNGLSSSRKLSNYDLSDFHELLEGAGITTLSDEEIDSIFHDLHIETVSNEFLKFTERETVWEELRRIKIQANIHQPQGMTLIDNEFYVITSVQIVSENANENGNGSENQEENKDENDDGNENENQSASESTPKKKKKGGRKKGIAHVFAVSAEDGQIIATRELTKSDASEFRFVPSGVDYDGHNNVWFALSEHRPNSTAVVCRLNPQTLESEVAFKVDDHIGAIVYDRLKHIVYGMSFGGRTCYAWKEDGTQIQKFANPSPLQAQDCQYAGMGTGICCGLQTKSVIADIAQAEAEAQNEDVNVNVNGNGNEEDSNANNKESVESAADVPAVVPKVAKVAVAVDESVRQIGGLELVALKDSKLIHALPQNWFAMETLSASQVEIDPASKKMVLARNPLFVEKVVKKRGLRFHFLPEDGKNAHIFVYHATHDDSEGGCCNAEACVIL